MTATICRACVGDLHPDAEDALGAWHGRDRLVRGARGIPGRRTPVAPGRECHAVGAGPIAGIDGARLGPDGNGGGR